MQGCKTSEIVHLQEYKGGGFVFSIIQMGKIVCSGEPRVVVRVWEGVHIHPVAHSPNSRLGCFNRKKKEEICFRAVKKQGEVCAV